MANGSRDVQLVIKAKDDASKTVEAIAKALNDLTSGITSTEKSIDKGDTAFTKLGKTLGTLDKALRGVSSTDRLAKQFDAATVSANNLDKSIGDTEKKVSELADRMAQAATATATYEKNLKDTTAALEREKTSLKDAQAAHKQLNGNLKEAATQRATLEAAEKKLTAAIDQQQAKIAGYEAKIAGLSQEISQTAEPTKRLVNNLTAATTGLDKYVAKLSASEAALAATRQGVLATAEAEVDLTQKLTASETALAGQAAKIGELTAAKKEQQSVTKSVAQAEQQLAREYQQATQSLAQQQTGAARASEALLQIATASELAKDATADLAKAATGPLREALSTQQSVVARLKNSYVDFGQSLKTLAQSTAQIGPPTQQTAEAFTRLQNVAAATRKTISEEETALRALVAAMREPITSTADLAAKQQLFTSTLTQGVRALAETTAAIEKEAAAGARVAATNRARAASYAEVGNATRKTADDTNAVSAANEKLSESYKKVANSSRQALDVSQRLKAEVLSLISTYGGIYGVITLLGQVIDSYKVLEAAQSRLRALNNGDEAKSAQDLDFVRRQADRLGISFGTLAEEYTKFAASTKGTIIQGEKTKQVFLSIAEAGRVNKLSLDDMAGIFKAVTQIASKGKFQLEELSGQLGDRLPGALQILADGLGITVAQLLKLTKNGEVASGALVNFAQELDKRYGSALAASLETTTTALGRLQNASFKALLSFGEGGFIEGFTKLIKDLTQVLNSADFQALLGHISGGLGLLAQALGLAATNWRLLSAAVSVFVGLKLAPVLIGFAKGFGDMVTAVKLGTVEIRAAQQLTAEIPGTFTRAATAVGLLANGFRALLSSTGVGLALAAVSFAITSWATSATEASKAMEVHQKIVDQVKNAYDGAKGSAKNWAEVIKGITKDQAVTSLQNVTKALQDQSKAAFEGTQQLRALASRGPALDQLGQNTQAVAKQMLALVDSFEKSAKSADDIDRFRQSMDLLVRSTDNTTLKDFGRDARDSADELKPFAKAVDDAQLVLKVLFGNADESSAAMNKLMGISTDTGKEMGDAAVGGDTFNTALDKLDKTVLRLTGSLDHLKDRLQLDAEFEAAAKGAKNMGELNTALAKYNEGLKALDGKEANRIFGNASNGVQAAANLIRDRENFSPSSYFDVNHERVGFGSDTVTDIDGTFREVVKGMTTTLEAANRDLYRRIGEFQNGIVQKIGADRFNSFSAQEQGALTSIAYNYGSLPDRITDAVKNGSKEEIATAIQGLGGDNGGINRKRRNIEAAAFSNDDQDAQNKKFDKDREDEQKKEAATKQRIADGQTEIEQQTLINDGKGREAAITEAIAKAKKENPAINAQEIAAITEQAGKLYDLKQVSKDIKDDKKEAVAAEQQVNALLAQQNALAQQYKNQIKTGDTTGAAATKEQLAGINAELLKAIDNAEAMWKSIGGPVADAAITRLETARIKASQLSVQAKQNFIDWEKVGNLFVDGLTNAFDQFAQAVANGENVAEAARDAFLKFAADFLIEIGKMIIRQALFNLLRGLGGPFANLGLGAGAATAHTGGLVGSSRVGSGNQTRNVNPAIFSAAPRFHTGGIVGLRPGEVPIIAKQGEEVLKENDPRHILNGGGGMMAGPGPAAAPNIKIVNSFDAPSVVSDALSTVTGEQAVLNVIKKNRGAVRDITR